MGSCLGFLDSISLHDSALLVQAQVPGPARAALAVERGGIQNVVVLEDTFLKATLSCEMWLRRQRPRKAHKETQKDVSLDRRGPWEDQEPR